MTAAAVIWHDLECGAYTADLPLWRELAAAHAGRPLLDVGAGTGRVALDLAARGHAVIALERDEELVRELEHRARGLPIEVICADACAFTLPTPVALCIVPMQTVQLLSDRPAFLRCARAALEPGGLLALAVLGAGVQPFSAELDADTLEHRGVLYSSAPTAVRQTRDTVILERRRSASSDPDERGALDVTTLARLDAAALRGEAAPAGFTHAGLRQLAPTAEHVGTDVVLLRAQ